MGRNNTKNEGRLGDLNPGPTHYENTTSSPRDLLPQGAFRGEDPQEHIHAIPTRNNFRRWIRGREFCRRQMAYSEEVTIMHSDTEFAEEAGERIQQAFALCAFAAELVGKASEE
jgi:hypothetical protein